MIYQELQQLETKGTPIRVGVSGAGWIGSGFVAQVTHVPGMSVNVLADADTQAAWEAFIAIGVGREDIVEAHAPGPAMDGLRDWRTGQPHARSPGVPRLPYRGCIAL